MRRFLGAVSVVLALVAVTACQGSETDDAGGGSAASTSASSISTSTSSSSISASATTTVVVLEPTTTTATTGTTGLPRVPEGFSSVVIEVTRPDGRVERWCVLLAATPREQATGLMEVDSLGGYDGMLFTFGTETVTQFYMLKTRIPLSIAFFGTDGSFVSATDMPPCPEDDDDPFCPRYGAEAPYAFALEVPMGELARLGIEDGSKLQALLDQPC